MKIFKNKIRFALVLLLAIITTFAGCRKDFLDRQTQGAYDQDNYPYPEGSGPFDQFINGAYASLRSYNVTVFPFVSIVSIRSDDADKGSTPADGGDQIQMDNFTITPSNGVVNAFWIGHYDLINKCNFVLERVTQDPNPNTPEALKAGARAEARFLRAYAYFMLVRSYSNVPIVDTVITKTAAEANIPQSAAPVVYQFIENDLLFAVANLPISYDSKFIGRATRGAALGLLAKVYLYQRKFASAMSTANLVMTSGQYNLSTPYTKIFNEEGENSSESLFEVQATATPSNPTTYGSQYSSVQGVRGTGEWNFGWGFNVPSTALESAFEANDPRKARTILYAGGTSLYGEAVPAGLPNPRYNNKVSSSPARRAQIGNRGAWWNNVRLLRYSDVVLMYAEAANEIGGTANTTNALQALNSVRARARAGNNAILPNVTTTIQTELRNAIRQERRVELAMEHERFFDTVRWGIVADVLQAQGKNFVTGKHELLPIPQTQIDLSKGVLKQNPNY
jgi:hypothetical protein